MTDSIEKIIKMLDEARIFILCSISVDKNRDDPISYSIFHPSVYFYFLKKKIEKKLKKQNLIMVF